ncbi:MAG TPA: protein kinase [Gemmataceae bacterium]|nr:protein kinase [Gemmataceae bacterium]
MKQFDDGNLESTACQPPVESEPTPREDDLRVIAALEEYLAALEAGESPDRDAFLARHAEIAAVLARSLEGLEFIQKADPEMERAPSHAQAHLHPEGPLGDFRLVREIGRGGMGVVYEAVQISLGRRVALKVLPFAATLDGRQLQRFKNEAQAAAHLHHTNIVPVFYVGCDRGVHYYAMQLIEGHSLAELISDLRTSILDLRPSALDSKEMAPEFNEQRFTVDVPNSSFQDQRSKFQDLKSKIGNTALAVTTERSITTRDFFANVVRLGIQAAEALEHAHQMGVVHRDIKPGNLLLDHAPLALHSSRLAPRSSPLHLWITDFGLAQFQSKTDLTMTGDLVGTLRYMSPEQALAQRVIIDHRTDIYSLGATLYELLTLEPAFNGKDRQELLHQIAFEEPKPLRRINPSVPQEVETIVLKAIEKNAADRYGSAQELADDLRRFLEDRPIQARRPTLRQCVIKWGRRHKAIVWSAMGMLALAAFAFAFSTLLIARERDKAEANYHEAEMQRASAHASLETAYKVLDEIYVEFAEKRLPRQKKLEPEDKALLQKALNFYEGFVDRQNKDQASQERAAKACCRIAAIQAHLTLHGPAEESLKKAIAKYGQLMNDYASERYYEEQLAGVYRDLANVYKRQQRWEEARANLLQAFEFIKRLESSQPKLVRYQRLKVRTYVELAQLQNLSGQKSEALLAYEKAKLIMEKMVIDYPAITEYRRTFGSICRELGIMYAGYGRWPDAERAFKIAKIHGEDVVHSDPHDWLSRAALLDCYYALATFLFARGRTDEAEQLFHVSLALWEQFMRDFGDQANDPDVGGAISNFAFLLASCPICTLRDPQRAVRLAKEVADHYPTHGYKWNALGVAHYRMGQYALAVTALSKSVELGEPDEADWFFLAMSNWKLGHKEDAHKYWEKAVQWMEEKDAFTDEQMLFREEAAALMNIKDAKVMELQARRLKQDASSVSQ